MNTNSFFRTSMATSFTTRKFFKKITHDIHLQLSQWESNVEVEVESWRSYVVKVRYVNQTFRMTFSKNEIDLLQNEGPYALDRVIWNELVKNGLKLKVSEGNYLAMVFTTQQNQSKIS